MEEKNGQYFNSHGDIILYVIYIWPQSPSYLETDYGHDSQQGILFFPVEFTVHWERYFKNAIQEVAWTELLYTFFNML